jgi:hypothetical protein
MGGLKMMIAIVLVITFVFIAGSIVQNRWIVSLLESLPARFMLVFLVLLAGLAVLPDHLF